MTVIRLGRLRLQLARVSSSYEARQLQADLRTLRVPHAATVPAFNPPLQLDWGTLPCEQHLRDCVTRMTGRPVTHQERWRLQSSPRYPTDAAVGAVRVSRYCPGTCWCGTGSPASKRRRCPPAATS